MTLRALATALLDPAGLTSARVRALHWLHTAQSMLGAGGAAVESRMSDSFHWTELYLGALLALLAMLGAALLFWEWREHRRKRDGLRTAENLRFNMDANYIKRLIGEVPLHSTKDPVCYFGIMPRMHACVR